MFCIHLMSSVFFCPVALHSVKRLSWLTSSSLLVMLLLPVRFIFFFRRTTVMASYRNGKSYITSSIIFSIVTPVHKLRVFQRIIRVWYATTDGGGNTTRKPGRPKGDYPGHTLRRRMVIRGRFKSVFVFTPPSRVYAARVRAMPSPRLKKNKMNTSREPITYVYI